MSPARINLSGWRSGGQRANAAGDGSAGGYIIIFNFYSTIFLIMAKKTNPDKPFEIPLPEKHPETNPPFDPEEPIIPEEEPDIIPDEDPFETPPYEIPEPGEGP
jgi:hypothetical protein